MRLELLCEMTLTYRKESAYNAPFIILRPYGGEEGSAYGEGDGVITGERLSGTSRWVNHPHRRSDKTMLPNTNGIITTHDGAFVLFSLEGRTIFPTPKGNQLLTVTFEAEDPRYTWLNETFCVMEGVIDLETGQFNTRVYRCINELAEAAQ